MLSSIRRSKFARDIVTLSSGTLLSQLLLVGATPIMTRIYSPSAFGELALFTAYATVLAGIFTVKYELAIILPPEDAIALRLMKLTALLSFGLSLGCLAIMLLLLRVWRVAIPSYFFLLPALTFVVGLYSTLQQWFSRKQQFRITARSGVINTIVNVVVCFVLPALGLALHGQLVLAFVAGSAASAGYCLYRFCGTYSCSWRESKGALKEVLIRYGKFPRHMVLSSLLGLVSYQAVPLLLERFFSIETVGHYSIASRFLFLPSVLVGGAVADVFRVEFARRLNGQIDLRPFFSGVLRKLVYIGVPAFGILFAGSPVLFTLVLGRAFSPSGIYAQDLCIGVLGQFLMQPLSAVYFVLQETRRYLVCQALLAAIPFLAIPLGNYLFGSVGSSLLLMSSLTFAVAASIVFDAYGRVARASIGQSRAPVVGG